MMEREGLNRCDGGIAQHGIRPEFWDGGMPPGEWEYWSGHQITKTGWRAARRCCNMIWGKKMRTRASQRWPGVSARWPWVSWEKSWSSLWADGCCPANTPKRYRRNCM